MPRRNKYTKRKKKQKRKYNKKGGAESDEPVLNIGDRNIFDDIEDLGPVYGPDIDSLTGDDDGWNTDDSAEVWNKRKKEWEEEEETLPSGWELTRTPSGRDSLTGDDDGWNTDDSAEVWNKRKKEWGEEETLPSGWELTRSPSGREYYTDHNTQTTQLERPNLKATAPDPSLVYQEEFDQFYPDMPEDIKKIRLKPRIGSLIDPKCTDNFDTSVKMIVGHGSVMAEKGFIIPEGVRIISLSQTNVCIVAPPDINDVEPLLKYYIDGYTIFQDDDNKKEQELTLDRVIDRYQKMGSRVYNSVNDFNFQYGLHLPGESYPETKIQLRGGGCDSDDPGGGFNCSVICFQKGTKDYNKIFHYKPGTEDLTGVDGEGKYELIKLSDMIEKMGKGTYILFTCRHFEGDEEQYAITKTMSAKNRGPGYIIPPTKPLVESSILPGKKLYSLSTVQPPDPDLRRLKRFIIKEDKNEPIIESFKQSGIEWLVLEVWLHSNGFNFDKTGERYFSNNYHLLKTIFDEMDFNKDDFIDLDDIIRVEIVEKDSDEKRNNYFKNISLGKRILFKLPAVLIKLCGDKKSNNFQMERFPFYESIIKAVKYSMGENRLIHPPKE